MANRVCLLSAFLFSAACLEPIDPETIGVGEQESSTSTSQGIVGGAGRLAAGGNSTCLIDTGPAAYGQADWHLFCWGQNDQGQLGLGDLTNRTTPTQVGTRRYQYVTVGEKHTCAREINTSNVYCWGMNDHGQLGDGTTIDRTTPTLVTGWPAGYELEILGGGIAVGGESSCAIVKKINGVTVWRLYCWGMNDAGQLGDGTTITRTQPTHITGGAADPFLSVAQVSVGWKTTCATGYRTSSGGAWPNAKNFCWGRNDQGQIGDNTRIDRVLPTNVNVFNTTTKIPWSGIHTYYGHTCAGSYNLTAPSGSNGDYFCWGDNAMGNLGDGTYVDRLVPTAVATPFPGRGLYSQSVGSYHTCAAPTNGTIAMYCWGYNASGQLGLGNFTYQYNTPQAVASLNSTFTSDITAGGYDWTGFYPAAGFDHTCATYSVYVPAVGHSKTKVYCWGASSYGQVGDGTLSYRPSPVLVYNN